MARHYVRPDSEFEIATRARRLLIRGDCLGILPTPIERLYEIANVEEIELERDAAASVFARFSAKAKDMISGLLSQVRGAADLKKRVVFIAADDSKPRILFARAHELGHQSLPWHYVDPQYLDDDRNLSRAIKAQFELEANLFAAETIYQGERFTHLARSYRPEFASIVELARIHGTSKQSTFWRFVEVHNEPLAGLMYYPRSRDSSVDGVPAGFVCKKEVRSPSFLAKYSGLTFDSQLDFRHPWAHVQFEPQQPVRGESCLIVNGRPCELNWEAFWNQYCLMVLVRRRPILRAVSGVLRRLQLVTSS